MATGGLTILFAGLIIAPPAVAGSTDCRPLEKATLRWIVPNASGGGYDAYSRLLQPFVEKRLQATVVVENRPDAGGLAGATLVRNAAPDGRTIGIINASGLLAAGLDRKTPNPATDYTILARILANDTVAFTGRDSGIKDLAALLKTARQRPIVIGVRDSGSTSIFAVPVMASLLGIDYELVTGYVGNSARVLAAMRGEIDLLLQNLDSTQRFVEDGELRPLLRLTAPRSADAGAVDPRLVSIPVLEGETGVAQRLAASTGRTRRLALEQAEALGDMIRAGRLIVAPSGLPDGIRRCLETTFASVLSSPEFRSAADRAKLAIEPAGAAQARADILAAAQSIAELAPLVRSAQQQVHR